jgi:hypothetical protein
MSIFNLHADVLGDYRDFIRSFFSSRMPRELTGASINGISAKLDATSVAEVLENVGLISPHHLEKFVDCPVWFCIQLNNTLGALFNCTEDGVR